MLTAKQEAYCQYLEIEKLSQREAYMRAYPNSKTWKPSTIDEAACRLAKHSKITARRQELRDELKDDIKNEAKWSREDAHNNLTWLIEKAKEEILRGEMSGPCVSAIINSVKELDGIFGVSEKAEGGGVLEDILAAVKKV
jgi:hypothetical protein